MASLQRALFGPRSSPRRAWGPAGLPALGSPGRAQKRAVPGPAAPLGPGRAQGWRSCSRGGVKWAGGKRVLQRTSVKRCLAPPWGRGGVGGKQCGIGKASFVDGEPDLGPNANGFMLFLKSQLFPLCLFTRMPLLRQKPSP